MIQFQVTGMSCAACSARVEKAVSKVPGVSSVSVSLLTNSMGVEGSFDPAAVIAAVQAAGYGAQMKSSDGEGSGSQVSSGGSSSWNREAEALRDTETPILVRRLIRSIIFLLLLMYVSMGHNMLGLPLPSYFHGNYLALTLTQMILATIVMLINKKFFVNGFGAIRHGSPNMDTLVA
ncbi:MAG: cation transporter, partial [Lachnospiraceae bacterium]|nr:cation transporter [Lachnospiraceae bacterium]